MDPNAFEFARPYWLAAGTVACGLVLWGMFWVDRRRTADLARLVHPRFHARLTPAVSPRLRWTKRILWLAAVMLFCTAAAGPQAGFEMREVKRRGIDILFAIDTSRSMLAEDLQPNRLERARMGIHDFLDRLKGDRVGLVPFAGSSYPLCPLTVDYDAFRGSLDALDTDIIPKAGTDVAAAIREAQKLLDQQGSRHRILVLITDGEDLQGDAMDAATEAKEKGMTVHTIGVGSVEGVQIPVTYPNGQRDYVRDQNGQVVVTKLDEKALQEIADATGGLYAPLGRGAEGLDRIYKEKLRLEPQNDQQSKMEKIPLLRYEWPLAAALLTLLMTFILPDRRREVKPRALPSAARRKPVPGVSVVLAVSAALLVSPGAANAQEDAQEDARVTFNRATEDYGTGNFAQAESGLRAALRTPDLTLQNRAYYNLGNTLYRLGQQAQEPDAMKKQWEEAIKAYDGALALNSSDEDAKYNRDLVQRKLDELNKAQDQKDDQKKDDKEEKKEDEKKEQEKKEDDQKNGQQQENEEEKKDGQQQENKEQQGGDSQEQKDQSQKDESEKKEGSEKDQQQGSEQKPGDQNAQEKEGGKSEGEQKEQQPAGGGEKEEKEKSAGQEQKEAAENKEGEKKDAAKAEGNEGEQKDGKDKPAEAKSIAEERSASNEMSAEEARRLLQTLRREERTVIPIDRPPTQRRGRDLNNTTKGKTW